MASSSSSIRVQPARNGAPAATASLDRTGRARSESIRVDIEIGYRVRASNTFYNLVYPFYLLEGRE